METLSNQSLQIDKKFDIKIYAISVLLSFLFIFFAFGPINLAGFYLGRFEDFNFASIFILIEFTILSYYCFKHRSKETLKKKLLILLSLIGVLLVGIFLLINFNIFGPYIFLPFLIMIVIGGGLIFVALFNVFMEIAQCDNKKYKIYLLLTLLLLTLGAVYYNYKTPDCGQTNGVCRSSFAKADLKKFCDNEHHWGSNFNDCIIDQAIKQDRVDYCDKYLIAGTDFPSETKEQANSRCKQTMLSPILRKNFTPR